MRKKVMWMAVTADELELPIAVEDTQSKLARRLGVSRDTISSNVYRMKMGMKTTCSKYRVYMVEDYEE